MQLGLNAVLYGGYDADTAFRLTKLAGYDAIEISPLPGMAEHFQLEGWRKQASGLKKLSKRYDLPISAMEVAIPDRKRLSTAFKAAKALGIPVVNIGSGGKSGDAGAWKPMIENLRELADMAGDEGVTLCVKAHVGASIYDTPTTLRALKEVPNLWLDMDPSHIYRAGEDPVRAIAKVVDRIRHVHIRDCKGGVPGGGAGRGSAPVAPIPPGPPLLQTNGRGDINLVGYIKTLHKAGYTGPVNLEVIGAKDLDLLECQTIAAEARGHMQACLQACGAR